MDQKTMVYLHNGILCSRKKEGAPTLCNSMDGTGEHYAKQNKPGDERHIPFNLTFNSPAFLFCYFKVIGTCHGN